VERISKGALALIRGTGKGRSKEDALAGGSGQRGRGPLFEKVSTWGYFRTTGIKAGKRLDERGKLDRHGRGEGKSLLMANQKNGEVGGERQESS